VGEVEAALRLHLPLRLYTSSVALRAPPSPQRGRQDFVIFNGRSNTYWKCHIYLYTMDTLRLLATKAGLQVKFMRQVQRYPLENHLYWLSQGKPGGHFKWSFMEMMG